MNAKHTPGPWFVVDHEDERGTWIACTEDGSGTHDDGSYMCMCASTIGAANARLIAAAPDMLAALKLAFAARADGLDDGDFYPAWIEPVREAIAKAEAAK